MDEPSSTTAPKRWSFRKIGSIILVILVVVLIADAARWLIPAWIKSRAESFASQAQDALEAGRFPEAQEEVAAALEIRPEDPRFLRLAARIYAAQRKADAANYYTALLKTTDATDRDRYEFIDFALDIRQPDLAKPLLRDTNPPNAEELYYKTRWLQVTGDLPGALKIAREMVAANNATFRHRFLLANLLLDTRDPGDIDEAKKILFEIASKSYRDRSPAIRRMASLPLSRRELLQLARLLRENPPLPANDYFLSSDFLFTANTNSLPALAKEAISRYASGYPLERAALGHWLNRHGLYEMTLENVKPDLKSPTVTAVRLDALAALKKWDDAMDLGKSAEAAGSTEIAAVIYQRLGTNSPVSTEATAALNRLGRAVQ